METTEAQKQVWQLMRAVVAAAEKQGMLSAETASLTIEGDEYCLTLARLDDLHPVQPPDFPIHDD